jgi:hypothetical protein
MQHLDFPIFAQGDRVYARLSSSPIATCPTDAIAAEVAARLNYSDVAGFEPPAPVATIPAVQWSREGNLTR